MEHRAAYAGPTRLAAAAINRQASERPPSSEAKDVKDDERSCDRRSACEQPSICPDPRFGRSQVLPFLRSSFPSSPPRLFRRVPRIAFINIQLIAQESAIGKAAAERINKLSGVRLAELEAKGQTLKALQDKQASATGILTKDAAERLQQEIDRAALEIQYAKQSADRELSNLNDDLMSDFSVKVRPVASKAFAPKSSSGPCS